MIALSWILATFVPLTYFVSTSIALWNEHIKPGVIPLPASVMLVPPESAIFGTSSIIVLIAMSAFAMRMWRFVRRLHLGFAMKAVAMTSPVLAVAAAAMNCASALCTVQVHFWGGMGLHFGCYAALLLSGLCFDAAMFVGRPAAFTALVIMFDVVQTALVGVYGGFGYYAVRQSERVYVDILAVIGYVTILITFIRFPVQQWQMTSGGQAGESRMPPRRKAKKQ